MNKQSVNYRIEIRNDESRSESYFVGLMRLQNSAVDHEISSGSSLEQVIRDIRKNDNNELCAIDFPKGI